MSQNKISLYNEKRSAILSYLEYLSVCDYFFRYEINWLKPKESYLATFIEKFANQESLSIAKLELFVNDKKINSLVSRVDSLQSAAFEELYKKANDSIQSLSFSKTFDYDQYLDILGEIDKTQDQLIVEFQRILNETTS